MFEQFFHVLTSIEHSMWNYVGVPAILLLGIFLSFKAKWFQVIKFPQITSLFFSFLFADHNNQQRGIHPLKAFFAALGSCLGLSNIIVVCAAVQIGGPGALFWMWIATLIGMIVKYSEIYLGIKFRVKNKLDSYDGGPMYFLQKATSNIWIPRVVCVLLCIYSADMYLFRVVTHTMVTMWGMNHFIAIGIFLAAILYATHKDMERVGNITSITVPVFLVLFSAISIYIFIQNLSLLPEIFAMIFRSAFTGHAALGAFTGSSALLTISQGMKRACYAEDIGIGHSSVINSETDEADPSKQASLGIFGMFIDTFIVCTMSVLLILVTGLWSQGVHENQIIALAIQQYIPCITIFWPAFIFLLGYSNIITIFSVGEKSAQFLFPKHGKLMYTVYASMTFLIFSFIGSAHQLLAILSIIGALLLFINLWGILKLHKHIEFKLKS